MLLTAKYVIPVTSPHIENGAVLVQDGKIVEVGTAAELKRKYPNEELRDFGLAALAPGFVDLHTHMRFTAMRGLFEDLPYSDWKRAVLRCEPFFEDVDWDNSARLGALEAIASGITTVADISTRDSALKAINEAGIRGVVYREIITMHARRAQAALEEGLADLEEWKKGSGSGRISFGLAGGPVYATHPKVYKAIADYVGGSDMHVAMHLGGSQEEYDFIRYGSSPFSVHASVDQGLNYTSVPWLPAGVSPIRYVRNWDILEVPNMMIVHAVHADDADIEMLARLNVAVAHCPRINAKLGMGFARVNHMLEAGITVGLGTDSPAAVDTTDMIDEMRVGLLLHRAFYKGRGGSMTGDKMLRMATIDAAKALRMDDSIGSLEAGKEADIIAVDLHNSHQNPTSDPSSAIIYTANQDNVMMTMVGGKMLYDNFVHISGLQRDQIVESARASRSRVRHGMNDDDLRQKILDRMEEDVSDQLKR